MAKPLRPALKGGSAAAPAQTAPPGPHRRVVLRFPKVLPWLACCPPALPGWQATATVRFVCMQGE